MRLKSGTLKEPAEKVVRGIRRAKFKRYSSEEKIRIVLEGLHGERQRWREFAPSSISAPGPACVKTCARQKSVENNSRQRQS